MRLCFSVLVVVLVVVSAAASTEGWDERMEKLVEDVYLTVANAHSRGDRLTSELQTRIIDQMVEEIEQQPGNSCFGRSFADENVLEEREMRESPLTKTLFESLSPLTEYKPCTSTLRKGNSAMEYDVWDFEKRTMELNQPFPDSSCSNGDLAIVIAPSPLHGELLEVYGLIVNNVARLSLFMEQVVYGEYGTHLALLALFKQVSMMLYNAANTDWLGKPNYFVYKLHVRHAERTDDWKLRGIELGKGVIPRELRKAGVELAQSWQENDGRPENGGKWAWVYTAPECTLLFPPPNQRQSPLSPPLDMPVNATMEEEEDLQIPKKGVDLSECIPILDFNAPIIDPVFSLFE